MAKTRTQRRSPTVNVRDVKARVQREHAETVTADGVVTRVETPGAALGETLPSVPLTSEAPGPAGTVHVAVERKPHNAHRR